MINYDELKRMAVLATDYTNLNFAPNVVLALIANHEALRDALVKIIEMNRQHAEDQYGDPDKAESWSCVTVAREAMSREG